jgi:hypothetical protein
MNKTYIQHVRPKLKTTNWKKFAHTTQKHTGTPQNICHPSNYIAMSVDRNAIQTLHKYFQANHLQWPPWCSEGRLDDHEGGMFFCEVEIPQVGPKRGYGTKKRSAQNEAAMHFLEALGMGNIPPSRPPTQPSTQSLTQSITWPTPVFPGQQVVRVQKTVSVMVQFVDGSMAHGFGKTEDDAYVHACQMGWSQPQSEPPPSFHE